ncbi:MAG: hypothetical protein R3B57_09940 [Phycisphaerales bacterium]
MHARPPAAALRCVLLRHDEPSAAWHHDLLLERPPSIPQAASDPDDRRLITFRLAENPFDPAISEADARRLSDHRAHYLDYEGPLSADRGRVRRLATARILHLDESPTRLTATLALDASNLTLHARRLDADRWRLVLTRLVRS